LKMLHLPSGHEILQACIQPTKVKDEPISGAIAIWKKIEL
jgi:hypothetical protein